MHLPLDLRRQKGSPPIRNDEFFGPSDVLNYIPKIRFLHPCFALIIIRTLPQIAPVVALKTPANAVGLSQDWDFQS